MNWIELIGQTLIHFVWQGGLLMGLAMALLLALRQRSAQSRYLACCVVMVLMASAPVVTALVLAPTIQAPTVATVLDASPSLAGSLESAAYTQTASPVPMPDEATLRWIVAGWLIGMMVLTLRVLGGFITLTGLSRRGHHPAPDDLMERFAELARRMGLTKLPKIYLSESVSVPTVIGAFRGMVLLPVSVATGMPPRLLDTILVHELAHVARFDFLVNAFQSVIEVVLFYHPAVWWVSQRIREERENCCDDLVIATLSDRKTYARALTALAELRGHSLAVRADGGELLVRIRRILGETSMKSILSPFPVAILLAALIAVPALQGYAAYAATDNPASIGQSPERRKTTPAKKPSASTVKRTAQVPLRTDPVRSRSSQNPLGRSNGLPPADVARPRSNQNPIGGTNSIPSADVARSLSSRSKLPYSNNLPPAGVVTSDPLSRGQSGPPSGTAIGPQMDPLSSLPTARAQDANPVAPMLVPQQKPDNRMRTPRQANEYLIEEVSQDIESLLEQRRIIRDCLNQTEKEMMEHKLRMEDLKVADPSDSEAEKERRIQEYRRLDAKIIRVVNQQKMLEESLQENAGHLADKRSQLEKAWRGSGSS